MHTLRREGRALTLHKMIRLPVPCRYKTFRHISANASAVDSLSLKLGTYLCPNHG